MIIHINLATSCSGVWLGSSFNGGQEATFSTLITGLAPVILGGQQPSTPFVDGLFSWLKTYPRSIRYRCQRQKGG